jgi:polyphosphate kinase
MAKKRKSAEPAEIVWRDAKEVAVVEQYWQTGEFSNLRKPRRNYKYVGELAHLQFELIKLQEWVRLYGLKVVIVFEGRDAAGKGGVIKRMLKV